MKLYFGKSFTLAYQHDAYAVGILEAKKNCHFWLMTEFISLRYNKELEEIRYGADYFLESKGPFYKIYHQCPKSFVEDGKLLSIIQSNLNDQRYVSIIWDEYYIPSKLFYQRRHYRHINLVIGYDDDRKVFHTVGVNANGHWGEVDVDYQTFIKAVDGFENDKYICFDTFSVDEKFERQFSLDDMLSAVESLLCTEQNDNGLSSIDMYMDYLKDRFAVKKFVPRESTYLLQEHAQIMISLLTYVKNEGMLEISDEIFKKYEDIKKNYNKIMYLVIKYEKKRTGEIEDNILTMLYETERKEREVLNHILEVFKQNG